MKFDNEKQAYEWLLIIHRSSIPLRRLNASKLPLGGLASGCLIDYLGKRLLLTVSHAVGNSDNWTIQVKYDPDIRQTVVYNLGSFNYLSEGTLGFSEMKDVDFAYVEIPCDLIVYMQDITPSGQCINEIQRIVFQPDFDIKPISSEIYGFSGEVLPEYIPDSSSIIVEHKIYYGLVYIRSENSCHYFKLPVEHPGHDQFEGCSGAPIIDTKGNIVALVCGGSLETNEIWGIALDKYKIALDITYGGVD